MTENHSDNSYSMYTNSCPPPQMSNCMGEHPADKGRAGKKKCGCLCGIIIALVAIFLLFLILSIVPITIIGLAGMVEEGNFSSLESNSHVIIKGTGSDVIAVMDVKGIITSSETPNAVNAARFKETLSKIESNPNVVALLLDMDTPGGEVTAADEIHKALIEFKNRREIPVITCMHSMGASGGYYIASASDHIIANRMTLTGSIGVIMSTFNASELMGKIGVTPVVFKSGDMKDILSPTRPMSDNERTYLDRMVKETFAEFAKVVADGREKYETADDVMKAEFADGRVLSGKDAMEFGLVDELGDFDDAINHITEKANCSSPSVIRYSSKPTLWETIMNSKASPLSPKSVLPVESFNIKAGQLYFILPQSIIW